MTQLALGDWLPMARRADPASSHEAATRIERSGAASHQRATAVALVERHPGRTR